MTTPGVTPEGFTLPAAAKAVLAFLALLATNAAEALMDHGHPWPADGGQWVRWGLTILLGTIAVYGVPNTTRDPVTAARQSVRLKAGPVPGRSV